MPAHVSSGATSGTVEDEVNVILLECVAENNLEKELEGLWDEDIQYSPQELPTATMSSPPRAGPVPPARSAQPKPHADAYHYAEA